MSFVTIASLILPLAVLATGIAAGFFIRLLLTRRLERATARRPRSMHLLLNVARGSAPLWFTTLGLYLAEETADLPAPAARLAGKALLALLIASVTWAAARIVGTLVASHETIGVLPSATVITNLARGLVLMLGFLVILQTLGISITPMITALGVGGLAVALALQDTLANLFGGLHILVSRQVRPGDFVRLDPNQEGYVQDVTWRYTSIRQPGNGLLVVPNAKFAAAITTNFTRPETRVTVPVAAAVTYEADLDQVERVTTEVAREVMREVPGGVPDAAPVILFQRLGMATIQFTAILTARDVASQGMVKHEFIKRLLRRFRKEQIALPGTSRDATLAEKASLSVAEQQGVI